MELADGTGAPKRLHRAELRPCPVEISPTTEPTGPPDDDTLLNGTVAGDPESDEEEDDDAEFHILRQSAGDVFPSGEGPEERLTMQKPTLKVIGTQYCLVPHTDVTALPSFPVRKIKFFHQNHLWF